MNKNQTSFGQLGEIENKLLAMLFRSERIRDQFAFALQPNDFIEEKNGLILTQIQHLLQQRRKTFNLDIFIHYLETKKMLKKVGGLDYIHKLISAYVSDEYAAKYFKLVLDEATRRKLLSDLNRLQTFISSCTDGEKMIQEFYKNITEWETFYDRLSKKFISLSHLIQIESQSSALWQTKIIERSTGFANLDDKIGGFQKGELIILAGRPSMGKTALALNMSLYNLQTSQQPFRDTIIFSLEMSPQQLVKRILKAHDQIILNKNEQSTNTSIDEFIEKLKSMNIFIDNSTSIDVLQIQAKLNEWQKKRPIGLVVIDYLQLLKPLKKNKYENRNLEVSQWTRQLKIMARDLNIPVLCLSQLSRNVERREEKRPLLSDLRDSGSIEQDADLVMFLYRELYYNKKNEDGQNTNSLVQEPHDAEIIIAKNRNGPIGSVNVLFVPKKVSFFQN